MSLIYHSRSYKSLTNLCGFQKIRKASKKGGSDRYKTPDEAGAVNLNKDKPWGSLFRDIEKTSFFCYNITSCISVQDDTDTFNSSMDYY